LEAGNWKLEIGFGSLLVMIATILAMFVIFTGLTCKSQDYVDHGVANLGCKSGAMMNRRITAYEFLEIAAARS
jgi:hypothetical protein